MQYKREITSRRVTWLTCYEAMSNEDRGLFFQAYDYNRKREMYILAEPKHLDKMLDKSGVLDNGKAND